MREWWSTPKAAWGFLGVGIGGGVVITFLVSPIVGIPLGIVLTSVGIWLIVQAYKNRNRLISDAHSKCKKGDHSWFNDERYKFVAYTYEYSDTKDNFGSTREKYFTKICRFCGHTETGLMV